MCQCQRVLFCIMVWINKTTFWYWTVVGILLGVGFVVPVLWVLGLVGGAGFLFLLNKSQSKKSLFLGALWAWTIKYLFAISWFWSTYPIEWLPVELDKAQLLVIFVYWSTTAFWLGFGALPMVGLFLLGKKYFKNEQLKFWLLLPLVWLSGEILGAYIFSIISMGEGGIITSAFSFGYSGYLLVEHNLLSLFGNFYGVYGLSFLFALLSLFIIKFVKSVSSSYRYTLGILLASLSLTSGVQFVAGEARFSEHYKILIIDTHFPINSLRNRQDDTLVKDELALAMGFALEYEPDYIVLPEDSRFFNQSKDPSLEKSFFQFQYNHPKTIIVDSGPISVDGSGILQAFVYDGLNNKYYQPQKNYLVPQGEFMPYLSTKIFRLLGYSEIMDSLSSKISFDVGKNKTQSDLEKEVPGVLFCFESVSPFGVRKLLNERPNMPFVAHPVSHAWFHESEVLWNQLDSMLKIQAMWNDSYIVSAGNHVSGRVVIPNGQMKTPQTIRRGEFWEIKEILIPK